MSKLEVYYDVISPYSYLGLELLKKSPLAENLEIEILPISLGTVLGETGNPGPANIPAKRPGALFDVCLQCRRHGIEIYGPPAHPFMPMVAMRFLHAISDLSERFDMALLINKLCWADGLAIDTEEALLAALEGANALKDEWRDLSGFVKANRGRQGYKQATRAALAKNVFGVPTFRYNEINFWGSDRLELLELYVADPSQFEDMHFERMMNLPSGL